MIRKYKLFKMFLYAILSLLPLVFGSCSKEKQPVPETKTSLDFKTFNDFNSYLTKVASINDSISRTQSLDSLWSYLSAHNKIPFVVADSVAFLYRGNANSVAWAGDFSQWNPSFVGLKVGNSNVWMCLKTFPSNSRLDYKIVLNSTNWIIDLANPLRQNSGYGENSVLKMPYYEEPHQTIYQNGITYGTFSTRQIIYSTQLAYNVAYRIYTPFGYENLSNLPVIYITDGQEYADGTLGCMLNVLDNMIHEGSIKPVIAVFIDPRNTETAENRRVTELNCNPQYAKFLATELVPHIDTTYKTAPLRESRAILGTSMGGLNSAYMGATYSNIFKLIAIQSPAFWYNNSVYTPYENGPMLNLKIFLSTGTIFDTQPEALRLKAILQAKGYPFKYIETNESHSWGNWKALLDDVLIYFFATQQS